MGIIGTLEEFRSPSTIVLTSPSITYKINEGNISNFSEGSSDCYIYVSNSTYQGKNSEILARISPLNLTNWNYVKVHISSSNARENTSYTVYVGISNNPNLNNFSFNTSYVNSFTGNMPSMIPMINVTSLSGVYYLFFGIKVTYGNYKSNFNVRFNGMTLTTQ